jgi:gluconolactonase
MPSLRARAGVSIVAMLSCACGTASTARFDDGQPSAGQTSSPAAGAATSGAATSGTTGSNDTGGSASAGTSAGGGGQSGAGAPPVGDAAGQTGTDGGRSPSAGGGGGFVCPAPPFAATPIASGATAERLAGVPPNDAFISDANDTVILEGPVWLDGNLYVSEIENGSAFGNGPGLGGGAGADGNATPAPPGRILKISDAGAVSVAFADVGSNGLALDPSGALVACSHKTGSISRLSLGGANPVALVSSYMGARFNSPNDLTFGADGTLYFTDPSYQAPKPAPQAAQLAYRVPPGSTSATPIGNGITQPNGITLSPDHKTLYISGSNGVFSHPVMADGSLGASSPFASDVVRSSDGMGVDCAGNLYTTSNQNVIIVSPQGKEVGRIAVSGVTSVSNVAFGGAEHKTIYITGLGNGTRGGVFKIASQIPGMPF